MYDDIHVDNPFVGTHVLTSRGHTHIGEQTPTLRAFKRMKPPEPPLQSSVTFWASAIIFPPEITEITLSSNVSKAFNKK